jgi:hypothetical protein
MRLIPILISTTFGQFVPDSDDYQDDLSFLDVAMDRGENAQLCDQLMRMAFLTTIVLFRIVIMVWGFVGDTVGSFYSRQKPKTPDGYRRLPIDQQLT